MTELHEAAAMGDVHAVENELSKGLDPNEPDPDWGGRTPLHIACARGHKKCVYVLLTAGARVDVTTDSGWTPAHYACETGQAQCLKNLLSAGCDLNVTDRSGDTAKRIAQIYGHVECVRVIDEFMKKEKQSNEEENEKDEQLPSLEQ